MSSRFPGFLQRKRYTVVDLTVSIFIFSSSNERCVSHPVSHLIPDPRVSIKKGKRQTVFASATGRSPVVVAAAERYMRKEPLFVGGFDKRRGRATGLPSNIRHTFVTTTKVVNLHDVHTILLSASSSREEICFLYPRVSRFYVSR